MGNLEISQLRALNSIVQNGGVGRAAEVLHLTQGAVSAQIRKLEETVGHSLLRRQGRGVVLTPEGESLLRYARQILDVNDHALAHMRNGKSNRTLNVGIPTDLADPFLFEIVNGFAEAHPNVVIRPYFNNTGELIKLYNQNVLDFMIGLDVEKRGVEITTCKVSWFYNGDESVTKKRPLPIVTGENPSARKMITRTMEIANIPFDYLPAAADVLAHAAIVQAGLAVTLQIDRKDSQPQFSRVPSGLLPEFPLHTVYFLYRTDSYDSVPLVMQDYFADMHRIAEQSFKMHF